ncbi:heme oxygenase 1 [Pectinophora gossypiella]|uniref:Heme oxygenase n=1 Tax=Pectinophora gossypiella TaxID=13191 RepID=A0A1E1WAK5_PECGO|nr:heme oxygenase 1 [Pectinophora gossypiella]
MSNGVELFTTRMRKATRQIHSMSDALVNAKFALSLNDETVWGGGLFIFYHVFAFLEDAKERLNMPDFNKMFVHKILYRKSAFEEDLNHYLGENWQAIPKSEALELYLKHLQELEKENPQLLMAYAYHLYLGLLSGGQILARKRKMFGGSNSTKETHKDKVTDFSDVEISQLKKDFRQVMNEIADTMTEQQKEEFIQESNQVFILNNLIVNSVGGQYRVLRHMLYKVAAFSVVVVGAIVAYKMYK